MIRRKKGSSPLDAVSIWPGGARSFSEAAGHEQRLCIWKRGGRTERLVAVGGVVFDGSNKDTVRWRRRRRRCGMATEEMRDDGDGVFG